jgi:FkbM family methyltransferase
VLVAGQKREEIWNKLPFRNLESLLILPDGNLLCYPWRDGCFRPLALIEQIYIFQTYDKLFKPERNFTVVDVGAHIGIYTLRAAKRVEGNGHIVAVEPDEENYRNLVKNIKINRYKNVIPIKLALSDCEGKAKFFIKGFSTQHSLKEKIDLETRVIRTREVTVMTLSRLLDKLHLGIIDLLKLDVEGSEYDVLKGSEELLAKHKILRMAIAAYHTSNESSLLEEYLEKFGFKVKTIKIVGLRHLYAVLPQEKGAFM